MKTRTRLATCALLGIAFFLIRPAVTVAEEPLVGTLPTFDPRALGMAGTLRASSSGTSGIYLNPAVLAISPIYHIELMYQFTGQENMHSGGLAVVDAVTSMIAAGLSFNYSGTRQQHLDHNAFDGRLALAGAIGDSFFLGVTGRYIHVNNNTSSDSFGPSGVPAFPSSGSVQVNGLTFDAGAALNAGSMVTIGVAGYNLTNTGSIYAPIKLGGGLSVHPMDMLLIEANGVVDFTSHDNAAFDLHVATELLLAESFGIRAGYIYDVYYNTNSITAGLGYIDRSFSLDFGFMREIINSGRTLLGFSFKYFVN